MWTAKSPKVGPLPDASPHSIAGFGSRYRDRASCTKYLSPDHSHRPFSLRSFLRLCGGTCPSEHVTRVRENSFARFGSHGKGATGENMILWYDTLVACRKIGTTIMSIFRSRGLVQSTCRLEHFTNIERKNHAISRSKGGWRCACL